jgi:hypothetical protein
MGWKCTAMQDIVALRRMTGMERDANLTIRIPAALKAALRERADAEERSVADIVIRVLTGRDEPLRLEREASAKRRARP